MMMIALLVTQCVFNAAIFALLVVQDRQVTRQARTIAILWNQVLELSKRLE